MSKLYTQYTRRVGGVLSRPNGQYLLLCGNLKYVLLEKSCKISGLTRTRLIMFWNHFFLIFFCVWALACVCLWDCVGHLSTSFKWLQPAPTQMTLFAAKKYFPISLESLTAAAKVPPSFQSDSDLIARDVDVRHQVFDGSTQVLLEAVWSALLFVAHFH